MTKNELVEQISEEYKKVGTPIKADDTFGVATYDMPVFEVTETGATKKTVPFYVVDEGKETEQAYLRNVKVVVEKTTETTTEE